MDELQLVKAKLEEMKAKYNFERENEDNPNHSDGCGMFYSGFFACLKEISFFLDTLEVKEVVNLEKEIDKFYGIYRKNGRTYSIEDNEECLDWKVDCNPDFETAFAKHFFELGLKMQENQNLDDIKRE